MTSRFALFLLGLAGACLLPAQDILESSPPNETAPRLSSEALEALLAPVALHPDALIALVLPAATNPTEIVLAARRLAANADPVTLDAEPWDDSVKALVRYPDMLTWLDENLDWTRQVGEAFLAQPADVMNAIQRLRAQARASGTLVDTPEQQIVVVEEHIRIVPARPDVIYVPRYDPAIVYVSRPYPRPVSFMSFSIGYGVGSWLAYDFDWPRRTFWIVPPPHRVSYWHDRRDWRLPVYHPGKPGFRDHRWHAWHPRSSPARPLSFAGRHERSSPPRSSGFSPSLRPGPSRPDAVRSPREVSPPRQDAAVSRPSPRTASSSWQQQARTDRDPNQTMRSPTNRERSAPPTSPRISNSPGATRTSPAVDAVAQPQRRETDATRENRSRPSNGQWSAERRASGWSPGVTPPSRSSESSREAVRSRSGSSENHDGNRSRSYSSQSSSESRAAYRSAGAGAGNRGSAESGRGDRTRR